ncbi:hypothetical protein AB0C59_08855 [Streptomyces sp. NPDC048664]|uniref:hypothetical protein n=1 Tax=Streptomyces sp. NPDC048664 TaxID=3154505 RepID=UPI003418B61F
MSEHDKGVVPWGHDSHERHEPYAWREPTDRREPDENDHEQHAGNAPVNQRPDAPSPTDPDIGGRARDEAGTGSGTGTGADVGVGMDGGADTGGGEPGHGAAPAPEGPGLGALDAEDAPGTDEEALRQLLHRAVREIEPSDGTLEHLRRAVPARRARKRQAVVGVAAAALFFGTAIPALVHVSDTTDLGADPAIAGQASQAGQDTAEGKDPDGGSRDAAGASGTSRTPGKDDGKGQGDQPGNGVSSGATGSADPSASPQSAPACTATQLGGATAAAGGPDSAGTIYGSFHVVNVSASACTVSDAGSVTAAAQGAADASKISVVTHVTTDAATGLPDPAQEVASLVLEPGAGYEIKFAWMPSQTCPTTGGGTGPGPTSDPTPSGTPSASDGAGGESGAAPQLMREDGVADGSVTVSHTPATGTATSTATIPDACAGTIYRTGLLPATS